MSSSSSHGLLALAGLTSSSSKGDDGASALAGGTSWSIEGHGEAELVDDREVVEYTGDSLVHSIGRARPRFDGGVNRRLAAAAADAQDAD